MKNYVQTSNTIHTVLANTVKGGDLVILGTVLAGIASCDGDGVSLVAVKTTGVFRVPKKGTDTFVQGAKAYWNSTDKNITSTASGNTLVGLTWKAAGNGDTEIEIALNNGV